MVLNSNAYAESYRTFVDVYGKKVINVTFDQYKIYADTITVNGVKLKEAKVEFINLENESDGPWSLKIISNNGDIILDIPITHQQNKWSERNEGSSTDGDTRILTNNLIIDNKPVDELVEIYAGE